MFLRSLRKWVSRRLSTSPRQSKSMRLYVFVQIKSIHIYFAATESVAQQLQKDLERHAFSLSTLANCMNCWLSNNVVFSDAGQSQNESRIPVSPQPNLSSPHSGRKQHPAVKISASQTVQILVRQRLQKIGLHFIYILHNLLHIR